MAGNRVVKVTLSAAVADYKKSMLEAAAATRSVGTEGEKLAQQRDAFRAYGGAALGVGTAMTALSFAVAKTGIEYNALQQSSRAALTTILGSAEAANAQMDKLDEFARTSPFSKQTFITAQQQMLAFGIETKKVIPYLDAVQNAVAAAGGSNAELAGIVATMSKIQSSSKVTAEDLNEFGNRGIDAATLIGSQMGKTGAQIREDITAGTLDAGQALDALAKGMEARFDGAAANVKNTWDGAVDRIGAAWRDLSADLMEPLVDPEGGGALVGIVNLGADILRTFQALPDPVKQAGGGLFAFAGAVAAVTGVTLLGIPKLVEYKTHMQNLNLSMKGTALAGAGVGIALTGLITILAAVSAAQAEARARAEAYAGTLEDGTYAITDATREMAGEALAAERSWLWLEKGSAYDAAERLGASLGTVTDAALGNAEAVKDLSDILNAAEGDEAALNRVMKESGLSRLEAVDTINTLVTAIREQNGALDDSRTLEAQKNRATAEGTEITADAAAAYMDASSEVSDLNDQLSKLIETINTANGVGQDAISANLSYRDALAGVDQAIADGATGWDTNTQAGRDNQAMLIDLAQQAQDAAHAQFDLDHNTDGYRATLEGSRQALIDRAVQLGANADEAAALADQIFRIPSDTEWKLIADTAAAQQAIDSFIWANDGRRINLIVDGVSGRQVHGSDVIARASGGPVHGPGGPTDDKVPAMLSNGEHVITAAEVQAAGGHARVAAWRAAMMSSRDGSASPSPWDAYVTRGEQGRNLGVWQTAGQHVSSPQQVSVSLDGAHISGTLDLGNGLTGFVDGRIHMHDAAAERELGRGGMNR